jgi:4-hydroxy-tetrahydrodipicolinate synthase
MLRLGGIDWPACAQVLDHVIHGGVDAVFVLGTTGEGPSLSPEEKREIVQRTCEQAAGRCPVYVGVTDASLLESLRLTDFSRSVGAVATVIAPPPYFPANTEEQVAYFESFARDSSLPVVLYNIPQMTKTAISLEAFDALLDHPKIVGIKDSSGQMVYFRRLQFHASRRPDLALLIGADELLAEAVLLGAHGGVTGGANLAPALFKQLYLAAVRHDLAAVTSLQKVVMGLSCQLYSREGGGRIIQGIKAGLAQAGLCGPWVAKPLLAAGPALTEFARTAMAGLALAPAPQVGGERE